MELTPRETEFGSDAKDWLGSEHGTDTCESIQLDAALFLAVFADGIVPSGVVVGKVDATGRYGPYDAAAVDGREVARGHLFDGRKVEANRHPAAPLLWHGQVREDRLPDDHGLDEDAKAALPLIHYV